MNTNVLVGGRDRKDVLAQRLKQLETLSVDQDGASVILGNAGVSVYGRLQVEAKKPNLTRKLEDGSVSSGLFFNQSIESFASRPGNYNRHLMPWEAFYIVRNALHHGPDHLFHGITVDMFQGKEWLDLVVEALPKNLERPEKQIVVYQHPRGLFGYENRFTGVHYDCHAMTFTSKRTFNLNGLPLAENIPLREIHKHNRSLFDHLIRFPPTNEDSFRGWYLRLPSRSEGKRPMDLSTPGSGMDTHIILSAQGSYAQSRGVHDPNYKPEVKA